MIKSYGFYHEHYGHNSPLKAGIIEGEKMKPRKVYRSRPKKVGAKKTQKISSQKRRLIEAGYDEKKLDKMNSVEIRDLLKEAGKKKKLV